MVMTSTQKTNPDWADQIISTVIQEIDARGLLQPDGSFEVALALLLLSRVVAGLIATIPAEDHAHYTRAFNKILKAAIKEITDNQSAVKH